MAGIARYDNPPTMRSNDIFINAIKKYARAYPKKANIHKIPETIKILPYIASFLFPTRNKEIPKHRSMGIRDIIVTEKPYILATYSSKSPQFKQYA